MLVRGPFLCAVRTVICHVQIVVNKKLVSIMNTMIHTPQLRLMLIAGALLVSIPQTSLAQTDADAFRFSERLPATSVRAMGVGGGGFGGFADYSALFTNPAGLGYIQTSLLAGNLTNTDVTSEGLYDVPGFQSTTENDVTNMGLGSLGYVYSYPTVRGAFTFGIAYNRTNTFERDLLFGGENSNGSITEFFLPFPNEYTVDIDPGDDGVLDTDDDILFPSFTRGLSEIAFNTFAIDLDAALFDDGEAQPFFGAVQPGTTIQQNGRVTEEGGMNEVSFGGALEAARNLMIGVSVNVLFGNYEFRRTFEEDDFRNENDGAFGTVDFDFLRLNDRVETEIVGVNLRAGLSSNVTPDLRIGVSVETPSYYVLDETFDSRLETRFDNGDLFIYGDDFDEDLLRGEFEYEITTPWRLGVGAVYDIGRLTLLGDLEFMDWSQLEFRLNDLSVDDRRFFEQQNQAIQDNYDSVVNTRLGAEYALGKFILRTGFGYQPDPVSDRDLRTADGDELDRSKSYFSFGLGYRFSDDVRFDAAWMQQQFDSIYIAYDEVDVPVLIDESVERNFFSFGLTVGL